MLLQQSIQDGIKDGELSRCWYGSGFDTLKLIIASLSENTGVAVVGQHLIQKDAKEMNNWRWKNSHTVECERLISLWVCSANSISLCRIKS